MGRSRRRLTLLDHLLVAGSIAGGTYLILGRTGMHHTATILLGVLAGGMYFGRRLRLPHLRTPITWRRGRGR